MIRNAVKTLHPVCRTIWLCRSSYLLAQYASHAPNTYRHRHAQQAFSTRTHSVLPSTTQRSTIYAVATPPGKGGVAIIRVSGPDALQVYRRIVRDASGRSKTWKGKQREEPGLVADPEPRRMRRCTVVNPETGEELDDGLAVFFKGPHSFTTEDVLELHVHSGRATVNAVLLALARLHSPEAGNNWIPLRPAERGEFTRRAFLGGRVDLTQVEALRDLVNAETEAQRKIALSAARGSARSRLNEIRTSIIRAMAMVEAIIDFGEVDNVEDGVYDKARAMVEDLRTKICSYLDDKRRGEILRSGVRLVIFGPPNAGKSSLLNFLAQREAAIVTEIPGTTRDVLELCLDIGGLAVMVSDTAGLRHSDDVVENIGMDRAREKLSEADASICVMSLVEVSTASGEVRVPERVKHLLKPNTHVLLNKLDLCDEGLRIDAVRRAFSHCAGVWPMSLSTQAGANEFVRGLEGDLVKRFSMSSEEEAPLITTTRQRVHLDDARAFLEAFLDTDDIVLAAEELRYASDAVGKVTGQIGVEEVLDAVFAEFCIGK